MRDFLGMGENCPKWQDYACSKMQNKDGLLRLRLMADPRNDEGKVKHSANSLWPKAFLIIFCVLFSGFLVSPAYGQGTKGLNQTVLSGVVSSIVDGKPIEGASVAVDKRHAHTDKEGKFTISVDKPTGVLIIKHIGYKEQRVAYENTATIVNIALQANEKQIEEVEVVSTGYQKIPKERATGSFEFIDSALFNRKVSTDILSRLEDVVPSLSSLKFFEGNKGELPNINIRGMSTMKSQRWPLIVVDGMPYQGHFSTINPNDIENITVLKDAAAASIWGAQSGNGVIVVNTKGARYGAPLKVSANAAVTMSGKTDLYYQPQMSSSDYIDVELLLAEQGYYDGRMYDIYSSLSPVVQLLKLHKENLITKDQLINETDRMRNNDIRSDFMKYIYRKPINQQYNLQMTSGNDRSSTTFSIGYDKNLENIVTSDFDRFTMRNRSAFRPTDRLNIDISLQYSETKKQKTERDISYNQTYFPYGRLIGDDGQHLIMDNIGYNPAFRDTIAGGRLLDWKYRPLDELYATSLINKRKDIFVSAGVEYVLTSNLRASALFNYQGTSGTSDTWRGMGSVFLREEINHFAGWDDNGVYWGMPVGDYQYILNQKSNAYQGRTQISFDKHWEQGHAISAIAGAEVREVTDNAYSSIFYGLDRETLAYKPVDMNSEFPYLNGLLGMQRLPDYSQYGQQTNRYVSYFSNASYTFKDRYILSGSVRKDASNLFGVRTNDKGKPFWSIGGAWLLSKELFLPNIFELLKLRATYGYNGNVNNNTAAYPIINHQSQVHPITGQRYARIQSPPNPELRWENVGMLNLGLDFALRNNTLSGTIEFYRKTPRDLIASTRVDPSTGFSTLNINSANLLGTGGDLSLNSVNVKTGTFRWTSNLVSAYNRTTVTKSYVANPLGLNFIGGAYGMLLTPVEGADLHSLYAYRWAGLDPETGMPRGYIDGEMSADYAAIYNRTEIEGLENHGSVLPLYFGSLRNSFQFKNIEFSFNIAYQLGHKFMRNSINYSNLIADRLGHKDYANRWKEPGDERQTNTPVFNYPSNYYADAFYNFSSALVESASQIKWRDIQVSYSLPKTKFFKQGQLYGYVYNIATLWRANKLGIDPEYGVSSPEPLAVSLGARFTL